jgi:hypothetical protein
LTEQPFVEAMRKAATSLRDAARRSEDTAQAGIHADHASMCEVWRENAERLAASTQGDFRKLALQWVKEANAAPPP